MEWVTPIPFTDEMMQAKVFKEKERESHLAHFIKIAYNCRVIWVKFRERERESQVARYKKSFFPPICCS